MRIKSPYALNVKALEEWLRQRGHSKWWFIEELDVHPNTITNWFEGRTVPDNNMIGQLVILTGIEREDLLVSK